MADDKGRPAGDRVGVLHPLKVQAKIFNMGIREAQMSTNHQIVLTILRGEGEQRNGVYVRRRRCCTIKPQTIITMMERGADFATFKGEVDRA